MAMLRIDFAGVEELENAMKNYQGNTEEAINEVLHNEAGELIREEVQRLIPVSGRSWKGKKKPAKTSQSLMVVPSNLAVTVTTKKAYQYLYFPDDGTNTVRHVGNQQFFQRGGESQTEEITNRCIKRLVNALEEAM